MGQENLLARYSIVRELGHGATGRVYAARDRQTGAVVALKRFDPGLLGKPGVDSAERLLKRARAARRLEHPNIAKVHDAGETAGTVYVVTEMLEGESLRKILDAGPLPIARAVRIARDVAGGLAHAHLQGIVHGGIKPSNVIVLRSGAAKITDFGLAQAAPPPEQARGDPVDHRSDVFSLGVLLYEMLAHRPPFEGGAPPPPSELNPHAPRALDKIVLSMLAPQPASRMPGMPILLRELQALEEGLGAESVASTDRAEPTFSAPPAAPEPKVPAPDKEFDYHKAIAMMDRESRRERSSGSRLGIFMPLAALFALAGIGFAAFQYSPGLGELGIAVTRMKQALATGEPAPAPIPDLMPPKPVAAEPVASAQPAKAENPASAVAKVAAEGTEPADAAPATVPTRTARPKAEAPIPDPMPAKPLAAAPVALAQPAQAEGAASAVTKIPEQQPQEPTRAAQPTAKAQPAATARLVLAISPRGEIYIDGKHHGATPPLTSFDLEPGMHRIEVRNGSRMPYLTYMVVQAGEVRRIRYDFDTSRAVYPRRTASRTAHGISSR